jgi:hypothetical protein
MMQKHFGMNLNSLLARKPVFLDQMRLEVPWSELPALIDPHARLAQTGWLETLRCVPTSSSSGLERLINPFNDPQADGGAGQGKEALINNDPASAAQVVLAFNATSGDAWGDTSQTQPLPVRVIVIAFVGGQLDRVLFEFAGQARYLRQRPYQGLQQLRLMNVSRLQLGFQGQAALVDDNVMLATELSPERGVGAGVIPAEGGGALAESMLARSHSIRSCWRSLCNTTACRRRQTPAFCGSRRCFELVPQPYPSPGVSTLKECLCAAHTGCRSAQRGCSTGVGRPWRWCVDRRQHLNGHPKLIDNNRLGHGSNSQNEFALPPLRQSFDRSLKVVLDVLSLSDPTTEEAMFETVLYWDLVLCIVLSTSFDQID